MNTAVLAPIADRVATTVFIALITALVCVFIATLVFILRQRRQRRAAWRAYAAGRGARFIDDEGPWYNRHGPLIRGEHEGVDFTIDHFVVSTGKSSTTFTRIQAACARAGRTRLTLRHNGLWVSVARSMGMRFVETGDAHFDARFATRSKAHDAVEGMLDPLTRERMLQVDKRFTLAIKQGFATMRWRGFERDERMLDSAVAAMAALCRPQHADLAGARR